MMRRPLLFASLVLAAGCTRAPVRPPEVFTPDADRLVVTTLDLVAGSAVLLRSPRGDRLLVDGGAVAGFGVLVRLLDQHGALPPDHIVLTAQDPRRMGGLLFLLAGRDGQAGTRDDILPAGALLDPGPEFDCAALECRAWADLGGRTTARVGDTFDLGEGAWVRVVEVSGVTERGVDPAPGAPGSVSLLVGLGRYRQLVVGRPTPAAALALAEGVGPVDVVSTRGEELEALLAKDALTRLAPRILVVAVDPEAGCAPSPDALSKALALAGTVFLTGAPACEGDLPESVRIAGGHVVLRTDGERLEVRMRSLDGHPTGAPLEVTLDPAMSSL